VDFGHVGELSDPHRYRDALPLNAIRQSTAVVALKRER
jgi:hypothetical protein